MDLFSRQLESPIGPLRIAVDLQGRLHRLWFPAIATGEVPVVLPASPEAIGATVPDPTAGRALDGIARRLDRYFRGELDAIDDIDVAPRGTPLQAAVWSAVRRIPPGQVTSYGALAVRIGHADRRMARSVGMANAANPVAIVIPCHRVIGKDGSLRGYAWGLERKRWLLQHERDRIADARGARTDTGAPVLA